MNILKRVSNKLPLTIKIYLALLILYILFANWALSIDPYYYDRKPEKFDFRQDWND